MTTERKINNTETPSNTRATPSSLPLKVPSDDSGIRSESASYRKRKKHHAAAAFQKRLKRSSVESQTVSITRIDTPIYENGSVNFFSPVSPDSAKISTLSPVFSPPEPIAEENHASDSASLSRSVSPAIKSPVKVKQRQFRVSLSLPDKVEKRPRDKNPNSSGSTVPIWDDICSPERSPSVERDSCFASPKSPLSEAKKPKVEHAPPFVASPLPTTSKKQLGLNQAKRQSLIDQAKRQLEMIEAKQAAKISSLDMARTDKPTGTIISSPILKDGNRAKLDKVHSHADVLRKTISKSPPATLDTVVTTKSCQPVPTKCSVNSGIDIRPKSPVSKTASTSPTSDFVVLPASSRKVAVDKQMKSAVSCELSDTNLATNTTCSYLSNIDVGVTGKPVQSKSSAATTNPVVIDSIKLQERHIKKEIVAPTTLECSKPSQPAKKAQSNNEKPSAVKASQELITGVKTSATAATKVISTDNGNQSPTVAPVVQPSLQIGGEITRSPVETTNEASKKASSKVCNNTPLALSSTESPAQPTKPRPSVLIAEEKHRIIPANKSSTPGSSTAAPTPVITNTPPLRLQKESPEKLAGKIDRNSTTDPSRGQARARKLSVPTLSHLPSPTKPPRDFLSHKTATISTQGKIIIMPIIQPFEHVFSEGVNKSHSPPKTSKPGEHDDVIITSVEPCLGRSANSHLQESVPKEVTNTMV